MNNQFNPPGSSFQIKSTFQTFLSKKVSEKGKEKQHRSLMALRTVDNVRVSQNVTRLVSYFVYIIIFQPSWVQVSL